MTTPAQNVSVITPINQAFGQMKRLLFQPFDIGKWIVIGFCAWLANLGESSGSGFNGPSGRSKESVGEAYDQAREYVVSNLHWIVPLIVVIVLLVIAITVVLLWVNSRGKFMFLHCVSLDKAEIKEPWHRYATEANSLFWFRLVLWLIGLILVAPLIVLIIVMIVASSKQNNWTPGAIFTIIGSGLLLLPLGLLFLIIDKLTTDFVVPIMSLRRQRCLASWREFRGMLRANFWTFVLYLLFQVVIKLVIGAAILALVLATCCILACPLAIPFLGTVLLLPIIVFERAYSLFYLAQFGPEYNVFPAAPIPASPGTAS